MVDNWRVMGYGRNMIVLRTKTFSNWLDGLRDRVAVSRIQSRINRLEGGNFGDAEPVGEGVSELRIHHGPGYRLYCWREGEQVVVLLCGGDKSSQKRDIEKAKSLAAGWKKGNRNE